MKRIISLILTLAIAMSYAASVYAGDYDLTADEVKELYENSVLLSKQDICDKVMNIKVINTDDPLAGEKKLSDYISPEKAIIGTTDMYSTEEGDYVLYQIYAWNDDEALKTKKDIMYIEFSAASLEDKNTSIIPAIEFDFFKHYTYDMGDDPIGYMDFDYTAKKINKWNTDNVTAIYFDDFRLMITSGGVDYMVIEQGDYPPYDTCYGLVTAEQLEAASIADTEQNIRDYEEWLDKKRALTPNLEEVEKYEVDVEPTHYLDDYKNAEIPFSDLEGKGGAMLAAVALLKDKGVISGFEDNTFRPDNTLTRGEAATILTKLVKGEYDTVADFPDTENHWSRDAVNYLVSADIIHGYEDGMFRPDKDISYYEAINLVMSIMGYTGAMFHENTISMAMNEGFIDGMSSFADSTPITRLDFARLIANAFDIRMFVSAVSFESMFPTFVNLRDITLGSYIDGGELVNGRLFHTPTASLKWRYDYADEYFVIYDSILDDKVKEAYEEMKANRE